VSCDRVIRVRVWLSRNRVFPAFDVSDGVFQEVENNGIWGAQLYGLDHFSEGSFAHHKVTETGVQLCTMQGSFCQHSHSDAMSITQYELLILNK